jgi:hypothetical protein
MCVMVPDTIGVQCRTVLQYKYEVEAHISSRMDGGTIGRLPVGQYRYSESHDLCIPYYGSSRQCCMAGTRYICTQT